MYCAPDRYEGELALYQNDTPTLLHHYFERQAQLRPGSIAVEFSGSALSYAQLDRYANKIANYLVARGLRPTDLVGIYLRKSPRLYAVLLGILKAGGGYVPIDPKFPLDRVQSISDDAKLRFLISEDALADAIAGGVRTNLLRLDSEHDAIEWSPHIPLDRQDLTPGNLCYVIYTSGSTGRPKGVMIEHRNAAAFVNALAPVYRVDETDRVYQGFSVAFDASVEEIWAAFAHGGTLVVPTEDVERSPSDVAAFIDENHITYYSTVPTMLSMVDRDLPTVRTLVLGGEACSNELVSRWTKAGRRMLNTYGPTEATVVATWSECNAGVPVTIGRALPGYATYVLDDSGNRVAAGEEGELYIGGDGVGRGYMNLPEMTSSRFVPNRFDGDGTDLLYRTYDHVRLGEDGELHFLGRLDDQVKIRGFRIELSEIEAVLVSQPEIRAAAVGVTEVSQLKELAAYVICNEGVEALDREKLADKLRQKLPPYMVPKYLDIVAELPMMPSGKIDRKRLPAPQNLFKGMGNVVAPADPVEQIIADVWQECFKLPALSVEADFFIDLGGHSLLAAQCVNKLRASINNVALSVRDIYEHRKVRALAAELRRRGLDDVPCASDDPRQETAVPAKDCAPRNGVAAYVRWFTVTVQSIFAVLYYGIVAAPLAYTALIYSAVESGHLTADRAVELSIMLGFAAWPAMLLASILVKWVVIGRYKPGRYPLWGTYYLRWWIASRFQALSWSYIFVGTPLMSMYYRAMGARIGRNVTLGTAHCTAFDVVSIGEGTSIGLESQLLGYRVEDGHLIIAPVEIGKDCFVGMHCAIGLDARMEDGARLDDMSLLHDGTVIPSGEGWNGAPARKSSVGVPVPQNKPAGRLRAFTFAVLHLLLIYAMGYFLIASMLPALVLLVLSYQYWGIWGSLLAVFAAVPAALATYTFGVILIARFLGAPKESSVPLHTIRYLRHWFLAYMLENTKTLLNSAYATIYFPSLMRALGARVGKGSEVSTVSHMTPHLLEVGEGCFLADACIVGGHRIYGGTMQVEPVRIGDRTFIGNSALVPGGVTVGSNTLIGVGSTPPGGVCTVPDNTRWLGSPSFELPRTQQGYCFAEQALYMPTRWAMAERAFTDAMRILLPGFIFGVLAVGLFGSLVAAYKLLPLWLVIVLVAPLAALVAYLSVAAAAVVKHLLQGTLAPLVKPLWCRFVWRNELVNGVYEGVAASVMNPLLGTPLASACLRMMGCRVGRQCFIETTLFSEFDLVHIGDRAAINLGGTIQTHLFEDRIFKADRLTIGNDCSIGNMAFILYDTEMEAGSKLGPLSVLMKGERLPASTNWAGIPCEQVAAAATPRLQSRVARIVAGPRKMN
ncbi:MAG: Pls/PosA family non-ribosomal peptide synthetase [Hyphomicrobiaceae bacterium]